MEGKGGSATIRLPYDHAAHYSGLAGDTYWEFWRMAARGNDKNSGDGYHLDFRYSLTGYDAESERPWVRSSLHLGSLRTGRSCSAEMLWPGPLISEGSKARAAASRFWFRYIVGTPQTGGGLWEFRAKEGSWRFRAIDKMTTEVTDEGDKSAETVDLDLDLYLKKLVPGWTTRLPMQVFQNAPEEKISRSATSFSVEHSLSYSVEAHTSVKGRVSCKAFKIDFEGEARFEHCWSHGAQADDDKQGNHHVR